MKSLLLIQTAIADYRDQFIRLLADNYPELRIYVGEVYFEESVLTSSFVSSLSRVQVVRNFYFLGRRACWQMLHWSAILTSSVVVAELNPRLLSTWALLLVRLMAQKRTILWGHAWSRTGPRSSSEPLRHIMRKLSSGLIFYTDRQRAEFESRYPSFNRHVSVAPNSLYLAGEMENVRVLSVPQDFIYVGRLVASKKVSILLDAFQWFVRRNPQSHLHVVGSGDQISDLLLKVSVDNIPNVIFHGHVSDIQQLKRLYSGAVASVSPGYVGLSVTQSFSFGVPMIISRDEPHSPELESFVDGVNGSFFSTDDSASLCLAMEAWHARRESLAELAETIVAKCRADYSVERMVAGFKEAIYE